MAHSQVSHIAVALILHHGQVVIGQRPAGSHLEGYWEFPGGHIEADETVLTAAIRKAREETGLIVRGDWLIAESRYSDPQRSLQLSFVVCRPLICGIPRTPFQWVPCDRLRQFRMPPANTEVMELLATARIPGRSGEHLRITGARRHSGPDSQG